MSTIDTTVNWTTRKELNDHVMCRFGAKSNRNAIVLARAHTYVSILSVGKVGFPESTVRIDTVHEPLFWWFKDLWWNGISAEVRKCRCSLWSTRAQEIGVDVMEDNCTVLSTLLSKEGVH